MPWTTIKKLISNSISSIPNLWKDKFRKYKIGVVYSEFSSALPHTLSTFLTLPSMSQIGLRNQVTFLGGYCQTCSANAMEFTFTLKVNNSSRWGIQSQYIFLVLFLPMSSIIILTGALLKRFELPGMLSRLTNNVHSPLP